LLVKTSKLPEYVLFPAPFFNFPPLADSIILPCLLTTDFCNRAPKTESTVLPNKPNTAMARMKRIRAQIELPKNDSPGNITAAIAPIYAPPAMATPNPNGETPPLVPFGHGLNVVIRIG